MLRFILGTLLCLTLLSPGPSLAGKAIVAIDHFPPWKMADKMPYTGIDIQLVNALLNEIGMEASFQRYPWSRSLEMMRTGEVWLMTGVLRHPERERYIHFIDPPYKTKSSKVFYRRKDTKDIVTYEDLKRLTIGIQRGVHYFTRFDGDSRLNKKPVADDSFNFRKLAKGRLDTVVSTESQGDYLISTLGLQNEIVKSTYRHDDIIPVHFAVSKRSPLSRRLDTINAAARKLADNGTFDRIISEYFTKLKAKQ